MRSKGSQVSASLCRRVILNQVASSGELIGLFSQPKVASLDEENISVIKKKIDYEQMLNDLPNEKGIVYRGMAGFEEASSLATEGKFGAGKYSRRPFTLNLAQFVDKPNSSAFLSTSPHGHTVKQYMMGFQLIIAKGAIASMCYPAVIIRPQTAMLVDPHLFKIYQDTLDDAVGLGNRTGSENIFTLTQGNNEITAVLGATEEDDWRPIVDTDLHSIVLVQGAGRILSGFTKAETVNTTTIVNPFYRKRIMSIELLSIVSGKGGMAGEILKTVNERAQELGLVEETDRGLTLADVTKLMESPKYQELTKKYTTTGETMILQSVPKNIPVGSEELVEYVAFLIESNPLKELITSNDFDSSLHV
ncbi:hypothetical protein [Legionella maioricensis]|uniref:Uncharacterized protein n=1 Tax=Legionella maioricensis TaxID=2896528 RepID=A0A9X2D0J7_9GAMM|nr:hypothetical protein [Legionella maioricensis]MCL9683637.1 hypothetical protein [Legionella maioricensis]MCL9687659.1 hypothetical protein [Legionella maioricensis]